MMKILSLKSIFLFAITALTSCEDKVVVANKTNKPFPEAYELDEKTLKTAKTLESKTEEEEDSDVDLSPSKLTVKQGIEILENTKRQFTTGRYKKAVNTVPILVKEDVFHWMMKDGEIWTRFILQKEGDPLINGWQYELTTSENE